MMNSRRGETLLTTGLNLLAIMSSTAVANALEISLQANESIATQLGYDDILYFQPESPPSSDMMCSEQCPCPDDDGSNGGSCWCDLEMICGGSIPLDLSSSSSSSSPSNNADGGDNNILKFIWNAPQDSTIIIQGDYTTEASNAGEGNTQWITDGGDFGTEFELRFQTSASSSAGESNSCEMMYQDIPTDDITLRFDNNNDDGTTTTSGNSHTQKYHNELSMQRSFIELDSQCGIFLRIRFEPATNGLLDLQFSKFIIEAKYDSSTVAKGERMYDWSTSSYMWVRQPYDGSIRVVSSIVGSSSSTTSSTAVAGSTTTTESAIDEPSESTGATTTSSSSTAVSGTTTTVATTTATTTTALVTTNTTTTTCYHKEEGIKWGCSNPDRIECAPMSTKPPTSQITGYPSTTVVLECTSWKDVGCCQDGVGGYYAIDYCAGFGSGSCCAEGEADTNVGCVALIALATTTATTSNSQSEIVSAATTAITGGGATVFPPPSMTTTVFELATSTTTVPPLTTTMPSSEEETTTTTTTKPTPLPTAPPMSSSLCNHSVTFTLGLLVSSIFTLVWHF